MIIKNVKICTMTGKVIENGYVRFSDKITELGAMDELSPMIEEELDGGGRTLYPGFIDAHCHLGMWSDSLSMQTEGDDGNETTDPCTPHLRAIDSINALDRCFSDAVRAGVSGH